MPTLPKSALSALNATFSKEQAETLLALLAAVGGSDWDSIVDKPTSFPPSAHTHEWEDLTDAPEAPTWTTLSGKPATFPPTIGTTATTAMAGNTPIPPAATWANLSGKPAVIAAGADAAAARTAIGAGTSNLAIGTTASTAAAGNHTHTISDVAGLEARLIDIENRLDDLENPEEID